MKISLVLPFYNEAEVLPLLKDRLKALVGKLNAEVEVICVDDGSSDATAPLLDSWACEDKNVKAVILSRNFGHQLAVTAGVDHVTEDADAVVIMDADLQDPPEVIVEMVSKMREGYDVVYGTRRSREGETAFKKATAFAFYRLFRAAVDPRLPADTGDFRLLSRKAVDALKRMPERHRFLRGMTSWIGFRQTCVAYDRPKRAAGESKYPLRKMLSFSWNAVTSFSAFPLRLITAAGLMTTVLGFVYALYSLYVHYVLQDTVRGWTTIIVLLCLIGGLLLVSVGMVGEYTAKIYEEIKQRPLYLVDRTVNLSRDRNPAHTRS